MNNIILTEKPTRTEMGKVYFELDNSIETKEKLDQFFVDLGLTIVKNKSLGDEFFNRVSQVTDNDELTFDVIWYKNLATIRFGGKGTAFLECKFNKIVGSYLPYVERVTLDFYNGQHRTCTLAVKNQ